MTVLGIDPGSDRAGYAFVDEVNKAQNLVSYGCITTQRGTSEGARLSELYREINKLFSSFKPDFAALESIFFTTNAKTVIQVGQARGVILLAACEHHVPVVTYSPLEVKLAVSGYGRADKAQVQQMVKSILKLPKIPEPDDAADAVAIALTHCFSYKMKSI